MTGLIRGFRGIMPRLGANVFVASGAVVVGDVTLGPDVNIWYGAVLRGDDHAIRIGAGTNVQDLAMIHVSYEKHPTDIGAGVVIGHGAKLHGCAVGDGALIGIGAIVLDGATVGPGAMVGAGAVVSPGTVIPPGELWAGVPARRLREVRPAEAEFIAWDIAHYIRLAAAHRDQ